MCPWTTRGAGAFLGAALLSPLASSHFLSSPLASSHLFSSPLVSPYFLGTCKKWALVCQGIKPKHPKEDFLRTEQKLKEEKTDEKNDGK